MKTIIVCMPPEKGGVSPPEGSDMCSGHGSSSFSFVVSRKFTNVMCMHLFGLPVLSLIWQ